MLAIIISDNVKDLKRVGLEIRKVGQLLKCSEVKNMAINQNIAWKFIPERAIWRVDFGRVL